MSCNYADGLSPYSDKGVLGLDEKFENSEKVEEKCQILANWILDSHHVVVHTGAGISTSAGIPDFRGPKGVWTLESKGLKPDINISFDDAKPTRTHMALKKLVDVGHVKFIVTQNIDGLHMRTGICRDSIAELHGNMFTEKCNVCERQFMLQNATTSVGQKCLETPCPALRNSGRPCRGKMHDTILDWEANLPCDDLNLSEYHSCLADLNICLGTTLQIIPSGNLPLANIKHGGRVAIVNLQPTKHDKKAAMVINTYVDDVMVKIMKKLGLEIPEYEEINDPVKMKIENILEWTHCSKSLKAIAKLYYDRCRTKVKKRKSNLESEYTRPHKNCKKEEIKNSKTNLSFSAKVLKEEVKTEKCEKTFSNSNTGQNIQPVECSI